MSGVWADRWRDRRLWCSRCGRRATRSPFGERCPKSPVVFLDGYDCTDYLHDWRLRGLAAWRLRRWEERHRG